MEAIGPLLEFAQQHGVAVVSLFALALAVWKSGRWFATELVKPLVNDYLRPLFARQMRFLDTAEELVRRQSDDVAEIKLTLRHVEQRQSAHMLACGAEATPQPTGPCAT